MVWKLSAKQSGVLLDMLLSDSAWHRVSIQFYSSFQRG